MKYQFILKISNDLPHDEALNLIKWQNDFNRREYFRLGIVLFGGVCKCEWTGTDYLQNRITVVTEYDSIKLNLS